MNDLAWNSVANRALAVRPIDRPNGYHRMTTRQAIDRPIAMKPWEVLVPGATAVRSAFGQEPIVVEPVPDESGLATGGVVVTAGMLAVLIGVSLIVNYQLGKAMAPNEATESRWAWTNAIGGTVVPGFTVGMAVYRNYFRD